MQKSSCFFRLILRSLSVRNIFKVTLFILIMWFVYFAVSTILIPYPVEYREGASQVLTQLLLNGDNPFSASNQPLAMSNYGVLYSFFAYPFVMIFGNILAVYRSVNFILLLIIFLIIFQTAYKNGSDRSVALACALMIVIVLSSWGGFGAYPSVMGTFLFLSASLVPFKYSFTSKSLYLSAMLAVLAYYTKPYFVLSFGIVLAYVFFFISKKKSLLYGLFFSLILIVFYSLVRLVFEFYFIDTFWGNVVNANRQFTHMSKQLVELAKEFGLIFILMLWVGIKKIRNIHTSLFDKPIIPKINIRDFDQPVFLSPMNYFAFWTLCSIFAFVFLLGVHDGAYMTYAYQIILAPLLVWFALNIDFTAYKDKIVLPVVLLNILTLSSIFLNPDLLSQRNSPEWKELYNYVAKSTNVLNSPVIVSALLESNVLPVDAGQTEYYYRIVRPYPPTRLLGPEYGVFQRRGEEYKELILQSIRNKYYDRLLLTENQWLGIIFASDIENNYILVDKITVPMPQVNQNWTIEIWEPIK